MTKKEKREQIAQENARKKAAEANSRRGQLRYVSRDRRLQEAGGRMAKTANTD